MQKYSNVGKYAGNFIEFIKGLKTPLGLKLLSRPMGALVAILFTPTLLIIHKIITLRENNYIAAKLTKSIRIYN